MSMDSYIIITGEAGADHMPYVHTRGYQSHAVAIAQAKREAARRGPGAWWAVYFTTGGGVAHGEIARPDLIDREADSDGITAALEEIIREEQHAERVSINAYARRIWRAVCPRAMQVVIIAACVLVGLCMAGLFVMALVKMGGRVQ